MRQYAIRLVIALLLSAAMGCMGFAQSGASSSLNGIVVDQSGGVMPGAEVTVKNDATGAISKAITAENGTFSIPSLTAGTYTATVDVPSFKQSVVKNIVLVVGAPSNIRIVMQVGGRTETVTVVAGAEVVQSSTATVSTTLTTTQIANLPLQTRNALDFLVFMPNANTTGGARNTTFMGMASTFVNITVDGISTQDNYNKNSDGFYTMITARPDSIQEVTVATAAAGADSSGGGAVQIKFVTRGGNNEFRGSLYDYERNYAMNSNYWFNNRDIAPAYWGDGPGYGQTCTPQQLVSEWENCKAPRSKVILHQAGGRVGGPISIPGLFSGKDRAFFFVNYERFMMPSMATRNNTIFAPTMEQGIYSYVYRQSGQPDVVKAVDLWSVARTSGFTSTIDPTVQKLLADIRNAVGQQGTINSYPLVGTDPNYQNHIWQVKGMEIRNYLTTRFDVNLTAKHRIEAAFNGENRSREPDNVNGAAPRYPGFPNYGDNAGNRGAASFALRSTITARIVNEARGGFTMGTTLWYHNVPYDIASGVDGVADLGGYFWNVGSVSSPSIITNAERRNAPMKTFEDSLTWSKGSHNLSFGGKFEHRAGWRWTKIFSPTLGYGIPSSYDPAYAMFNSVNGPKNFPNATSTQISSAASLYASLTARITSISGTAYRDEDSGEYVFYGDANRRSRQRFLGLYVQDSWRMRPNFTLSLGARWEINFPWMPLNQSYSWSTPENVWGLSGVNSLFEPGASGGVPSEVYQYEPGSPAYNVDYKAINPSVGFAWSPQFGGFLEKMTGSGTQTVVRGGFSIAYLNYDVGTYDSMFFSNPGGNVSAARNQNLGNLIPAGGSYPLLFRDRMTDPHLLDPAPFPTEPAYPLLVGISNSVNAFEPDIRTPYTMSWSFGIQREITKDMAIEVRYAAQRSLQEWFQQDLNERTIVENDWIEEFSKAQGNLYANMAAAKGRTFRYDSTVPGTQPLPIILSYLSPNKLDPNNSNNYTSAVLGSTQAGVFTNTSYVNSLNTYSPAPNTIASALSGDATRRGYAIGNGLPANFFFVNPNVASAWIYKNGGGSMYDSMVVELRRRMSKGLLIQGSYTWAKGFNIDFLSWRSPWVKNLGSTLPHALKLNWVYDLPFGQGRALFGGAGRWTDMIIGGWEFEGTSRIQSANLRDLGNINLVGMSLEEFQDSLGIYFDDANKKIWYIPEDIRTQSYYAYQYDAGGFTSGAPSGRYVAPAGSAKGGNCIQVVSGDCAPRHFYYRGPSSFTRFDLSLVKRIRFTETTNFELRGEFLNAFNNVNFNSISTSSGSSLNMGLVNGGFTDNSNSQDPGGRLVQIVLRFNF